MPTPIPTFTRKFSLPGPEHRYRAMSFPKVGLMKILHPVHMGLKLRGYYNFYGVSGNYARLKSFFKAVKVKMYKWLNRRSERRSFTWQTFEAVTAYYRLEPPRTVWGKDPQLRLQLA